MGERAAEDNPSASATRPPAQIYRKGREGFVKATKICLPGEGRAPWQFQAPLPRIPEDIIRRDLARFSQTATTDAIGGARRRALVGHTRTL
jgi:hypothetical protein